MNHIPLLSVIVPVYNAESWLKECVESILMQTFYNYELILIDDGSRDSSGKICDSFKNIDNRIKVIHINNGGVSNARNVGIECASGKWITFIDSDDWVSSDYLSNFHIDDAIYDICYQGIQYAYDNGEKEILFSYPNIIFEFNSKCITDIEKTHLFFDGCPVAKIYRTSIIHNNNLRFNDKICMHEDHVFVLDYLKYVHKISFKSFIGYNYRRGLKESLSSRFHHPKDLMIASDLLRNNIAFFYEKGLLRKGKLYVELLTHYGFSQRLRAIVNLYRLHHKRSYRKIYILKEKTDSEIMNFYKSHFKSKTLSRLVFVKCFIYLPFYFFDSILWLLTYIKKS